jgi:CubicO group peptidase (beta-lactamase class C family)
VAALSFAQSRTLAQSAQFEAGKEALTSDAIMARVAENQDRSEALRKEYVYKQHIHIVTHKPKGRLMREETADYDMLPMLEGTQKQLRLLTGRYWHKGKYENFEGEPAPEASSLDGDLIHNFRNDLSNNESKDGLARDLFPLTTEEQKQYEFNLLGQENVQGRSAYHLAFEPKDKSEITWAGEAFIDATDFQPIRVFTKLSRRIPFAVRTLLGTDLPGIGFNVVYKRQDEGVWFPASFGTEFRLHVLFFLNRDISISLDNTAFEHTHVQTRMKVVGPVSAQAALDAETIQARVDRWIDPYLAAGDFSGVLLIAQGDRVLVAKAYGKADFKDDVANRIETRFRIASLSKTFTAAAIERLITEGKLSLNDHLSKYVSGIANGDKITVEQLLDHESGVGELDAADVYREGLSNGELIQRLRGVTPLFAPGADSHYSNEGYFLLAMILERVSGVSYDQFLQKNIFDPLHLTSTGSACKDLPQGPNATGHVPGAIEGSVVPLPFPEAAKVGPGSLFSNAHDLYLWLRAVDTNPMFQKNGLQYPYGWGKRNYSGRDLIEQSGIHEGFNAHMALYPKEHIYAVVLSNIQSGLLNRTPKDLEAILFGGETSRPPEVKPKGAGAAALEEYAGSYKSQSIPILQNFVVRDGQLYMQWGSYPFLRILTPTGNDEFFFRYEYAKVRFERDSKGSIARLVWQWPEGEPLAFTPIKLH